MKQVSWEKHTLWLSFVLPFGMMLIIFAAAGIYPMGGRSFLYSDMYHQYMPFFQEFKRLITSGDGLEYSWRTGLGGNFLVLFIYYLSSPLNWLSFLVPDSHLMEFMTYLIVVRIGLAGLTFGWYLKKHFGKSHILMAFFASFYAMSGFMAAYNWNIMWLDCVVLLPLVTYYLERLVAGESGLPYSILLGLCIFTNFYLSIMICIFLVLYFIMQIFVQKSWKTGNFLWFAGYSLLAGGLGAVLLVPEVVTILQTDFAGSSFPSQVKSYFSILEVLARHCVLTVPERGLDHWPNIYCGSGVLLLLPVYVMHKGIRTGKKLVYLLLTGFFLVSFATNGLDFIWHGWNYPNSLPARQSFIYIFLILIMAYEVWDQRDMVQKEHLVYGCLMAGAFILFCETYIDREQVPASGIWFTLAMVLALGSLFYLYQIHPEWKRRMWCGLAACLLLSLEVGVNTAYTSVGTTDRASYLDAAEEEHRLAAMAAEDRMERQAGGMYRIEKFSRRSKNDGALGGYPTASLFASTLNSHVADFYENLGMRHSKVYYSFDGATPLVAAMLNVEYMIGEEEDYSNALFEKIGEEGDASLYRNVYRLPFGYVLPPDTCLEKGQNGAEVQNDLVRSLGIEGDLLEEQEQAPKGESVTVTPQEGGIYYARLITGDVKKVEVAHGDFSQTYPDLKRGALLYLGQVEEGQSLTLRNADEAEDGEESDEKVIQVVVYRLNEEVLSKAIHAMSENTLEMVEISNSRIQGSIGMQDAGKLILSLPAEDGWTLWVDGSEREIETFGGALMGVSLDQGEHEIFLKYHVPGERAGQVVSLISLLAWTGMLVYQKRRQSLCKNENLQI